MATTTVQERKRFRQLEREQDKYERTWGPRIEAAIRRQITPFINAVRDRGPEYALGNITELVSPAPMMDVLSRLYQDVGTKAANSEWGYLLQEYGQEMTGQKAFGFNAIWSTLMQSYFNRWGAEKVVKITETERSRLRNWLIKAIQNPKSTNWELAKGLMSEDIPWRRAKVIARTETAYSTSAGAEVAAKRTGFVMVLTWLSAQDRRARQFPRDETNHKVMDGISIDQGDKFLVPRKGGATLMDRPHDPTAPADQVIMCRCKVVYRPKRDASGRLVRLMLPAGSSGRLIPSSI